MTTAILLLAAAAYAPMLTPWGEKVTPDNAWREYPRPQMVRANWTCLNGPWDYAVTSVTNTPGRPKAWDGKILVPFAIESRLSGVGRLLEPDEFLWYTRTIHCAPRKGERILLHFEGVDYRAMVFVGHREVTDVPHEGMHDPFTLDITDFVKPGANELTVCVWDPTGSRGENRHFNSRGKQDLAPHGCFYTRVSGIWQTVWMETVPETYVRDYTVTPDIDAGTVRFTFDTVGPKRDEEVKVTVCGPDGRKIAESEEDARKGVTVKMPKDFALWSPEQPNLYTFRVTFEDDAFTGYFAMRKFAKGKDAKGVLRFFLNNRPYFPLGTLDQGWWPDGLLTPPSEEAMAYDIATLKNCGFNMMRKHIKVEPRRYYALCDRLGLLVIQDLPCFNGIAHSPYDAATVTGYGMQRHELKAMVANLRNAPSVVGWLPYNEGWGQPGAFLTHATLDWIRRADPSRIVFGPSGYCDFEGGCPVPHNGSYEDAWTWRHLPADVCEAADTVDMHAYRGPGMPPVNDRRISFLGEFGGLGHPVSNHLWKVANGWGYGGVEDTKTPEGLEKAYLGLMDKLAILAAKGLSGSVYTQTTDVEIEVNGLMTYDRRVLKYNPAVLKKAHAKVIAAACGQAAKHEVAAWRGETLAFSFTHEPAVAEVPFVPALEGLPAGFVGKIGLARPVKFERKPNGGEFIASFDRVEWGAREKALGAGSKRLVVVEVKVPAGAKPGKVPFRAAGEPVTLTVVDRTLPEPKDWKYYLDLWQHPWAVSRWHGVKPFSKAHYDAMRPLWRTLADCGQKVLTVTITKLPWNHQCFDGYDTMVRHIKTKDGWKFDYSVFDEYVAFGRSCGIGPDISCYTMCPWGYNVYGEDESGREIKIEAKPGTPAFEDYWKPFLVDFAKHLKEKGWFGHTAISMDERAPADMRIITKFIKQYAGLRIATAGNFDPTDHPEIDMYSYSPDLASATPKLLKNNAARLADPKRITTCYVCCGPDKPNTFMDSPVAEAFWLGFFPASKNLDGFLRWAYNSWPYDPRHDASYGSWRAGDTFLVYNDGLPSMRLLELRNGIQAAEKFRILKETGAVPAATLDALAKKYDYETAKRPEATFDDLRTETLALVNAAKGAK